MRRAVRIIASVVVLSTLVVAGYYLVQFQSVDENTANMAGLVEDSVIVEAGDLIVTVSATGSITPIRQVALVFEFSAPVAEVNVREGQSVQAGDILASLETSELEIALTNAEIALDAQQVTYDALVAPAREVDIAVARAAVTAAQAQAGAASLGADPEQIEIARLQAEIARNQLWQAQLQRDLQAVNAAQVASQAAALGLGQGSAGPGNPADTITPQIQQAENGVALADIAVEGAANQPADVAALSSASAQIVAAQAQLERLLNGPTALELQIVETQIQIAQLGVEQADVALRQAFLIAPFDGVIAQNNLVTGELPPQGAAMQLIDQSSYFVDVAVDETDIVNVAVGQAVQLRLDALPNANITGRVTRVAVTPTRTGQLVTYMVRVTLDPTEAPVRTLMTTTATIIVNELANVLKLPNRFVRIDRSTQQAYVTVEADDGTFKEVAVELGVRNETESQITGGLEPGTRVVLVPREAFNPIG